MVTLDTYFDIDWDRCVKCYKCVELCTDTYKKYGHLGFLYIDEEDGIPDYLHDNPGCHHCEAIINGEKTPYACNKICEHGAMNITRY